MNIKKDMKRNSSMFGRLFQFVTSTLIYTFVFIIFAGIKVSGQTEPLYSNPIQGEIVSNERIDKSYTFFSSPTTLSVEVNLTARDQSNQLLVEIITSTGMRLLKWQVASSDQIRNTSQKRTVQITSPQNLTLRIFGLKSNPEGSYKILLNGINVKQRDSNPPLIKAETIAGISGEANQPNSEGFLKGQISDESGIKEVRINEQPIQLNNNGEFTVDLADLKGMKEVTITASDIYGNNSSKTLPLISSQIPAQNTSVNNENDFFVKPKLYILAVGVSKYANPDYNLLFSAKDAFDFADVMKKQKDLLYRDIEIKILTDENATRDAVIDGLDWITKVTTSKDVAMILLSGHGINDNSNRYYFAPHNFNLDKIASTGVKYTDIVSAVEDIAGKKIFFVDTCHSGNSIGSNLKRRDIAVETDAFVRELSSAENGAIVFNSSMGKQVSLEDPAWGNGAFTKALIEGLSGKAEVPGKKKVTINSLDLYVSERVKELTGGRQTPTTAKPQSVADFPIALKP